MRWVFDLDGVVWLTGTAIPGSAEGLERLRARDDRIAFVTNNSTPTISEYLARLHAAGITVAEDELVTSSQAAASLLDPGTRVSHVGGPGVVEALEQRGVDLVRHDRGPAAVVVGRSLHLDFDELAEAASAIRSGARFIATNTDATFPTPSGLEPGAGALVAYLEVGSGHKAQAAGKPEHAMADLVTSRLGHPDVVVGDRAETDGLFATRLESPFALVMTGVTRAADLPVSPSPQLVAADLAQVVDHFLRES
jgi:4-nitrophenyl phosphatase